MATPEGGAGAVYTGIAGGIKSLNIYQGPPRAAEDGAGLNVGTAVDQDTSAFGGGGSWRERRQQWQQASHQCCSPERWG